MDLEKMTMVMDQFEKQFEDLDVQSEYVEAAMSQSTTLTTPADQVDLLINQVFILFYVDLFICLFVPKDLFYFYFILFYFIG